MKKHQGFTLIEVLIALVIIAIALTALLRSTSQSTLFTQRVKEKTAMHWVAMDTIAKVQLGIYDINENQVFEQSQTVLGQTWFIQATLSKTPVKTMKQIKVDISAGKRAPILNTLRGFKLTS